MTLALDRNLDQQRLDVQSNIAHEMAIDGAADAAFGSHLKYTHPAYVAAYVAKLNELVKAGEMQTGNMGEILWGQSNINRYFVNGYADSPDPVYPSDSHALDGWGNEF